MINWDRRRQHLVIHLESTQLDCEILYENPHDSKDLALICHPHPLHQGTMYNKVVVALAKGAQDAGFATMRFNFPGVGQSTGDFDDGIGEGKVVESLLDLLHSSFQARNICLAGFSFGGAVASFTYNRLSAKVLVAPAFRFIEQKIQLEQPTLLLHSLDDQIVPVDPTLDLLKDVQKQSSQSQLPAQVQCMIYSDAGHFFEKYLDQIKEQTRSFLKIQVIDKIEN